MMAMSAITKIGTAIAGLAGRLLGKSDDSKAAELHAQVELTEAQAFQSGRIAPRYVFQYVLAIVFFAAAILLLIDVAWPDLLPGAPATQVGEVLSQCVDFFLSVFGE